MSQDTKNKSKMLEPRVSGEAHRCTQCSYQSGWPFQLYHHVKNTHKNHRVSAESLHSVVEPDHLSCTSCSFKSFYKVTLYEHCKQRHDRRVREQFASYTCDKCELVAHSGLSLVDHVDCGKLKMIRSKPNATGSKSMSVAEKIAYYILYNSKHKFNLKRNMLLHAGEAAADVEWHKCRHCAYRTQIEHGLRSHVLLRHCWATRASNKPKCDKCSYRANDKSGLRLHMLKHAKDDEVNWFECANCPFRTKYKSSLSQHVQRHRDDDRSGATSKALETFKCGKCPYGTDMKSRLKKHAKMHHPDA